MQNKTITVKGKDDNLIASIAHASAIVTAFTYIGIVIPLGIWLLQKEKSRYVEFQSKQALFYQGICMALIAAADLLTFVIAFISFGIGALVLLPFILFLRIILCTYAIYAAYKTYSGEQFKYAVLGDWLEKQ